MTDTVGVFFCERVCLFFFFDFFLILLLLVQLAIPHVFFSRVCKDLNIHIGEAGSYGVGNVFFDQQGQSLEKSKALFEETIKTVGLKCLGWRLVPTDNGDLGLAAKRSQPQIEQVFIERPKDASEKEFERLLFLVRQVRTASSL